MRIRSWNYSSMEPLYRGALGIVSKARCETKGGRFDAVTHLDPSLDAQKVQAALESRMSRVGGLRSPLLVRDKGFVEVDGRLCLASLLVDGVPLSHIVGEARLPARAACGVAARIAEALHTAYDRVPKRKRRAPGLIHGDLRLHDILLGDGGELRVANLGLRESNPDPMAAVLRDGAGVGRGWAAPELEDGAVCHATDVYSLMAILAWMVTGDGPDLSMGSEARHRELVTTTANAVHQATGEVALGELVTWGLQFDPAERPRAQEVFGWLMKLQRTLPGAAWQSEVALRLASARAAAVEALVEPPVDGRGAGGGPSEAPDWGESIAGLFDGDAHRLQTAIPGAGTDPQPARVSTVASIVVDPGRWKGSVAGVAPPEGASEDSISADSADELTMGADDDDLDLEEVATMELRVPASFSGLRDVALEATEGEGLELETEDEADFFLDDDEDTEAAFDLDAEETEYAPHWREDLPAAARGTEGGGALRIGVGGGRGVSSAGRDDLSGVAIPEHLFREVGPSDGPTEPPVQEAPVRAVRLTMPVHEDNLDGFVFVGSEEDAISATTGRGGVSLAAELGEEDEPTEAAPLGTAADEPSAAAEPSSAPEPVVPAAFDPSPTLPTHRDSHSFPIAVVLAIAVIVALMIGAPFIQAWRTPAPAPLSGGGAKVSSGEGSRVPSPPPETPAPSAPEPTPAPAPMDEAPKEDTPPSRSPKAAPAGRPAVPPPPLPPASKRRRAAGSEAAPSSRRSTGQSSAPAAAPAPAPAPAPDPEPAAAPAPETASPSPPEAPPTPSAPESTPASAPVESSAAESEATADPAPEPPSGQLVVEGDARSVTLVGSNGSFGAGPVPAGTYSIHASFSEGGASVISGPVEVVAGAPITIQCHAAFLTCRAR